jgi:hypothetical protein
VPGLEDEVNDGECGTSRFWNSFAIWSCPIHFFQSPTYVETSAPQLFESKPQPLIISTHQMGQKLSVTRSSSAYHEWSSDDSEDSLLIPHREPTEIEMARLSSIPHERTSRRRTRRGAHSTTPSPPERHVEKSPDVLLGPDHFRALSTAALSPRPQLDTLSTLSEPSPDAFLRHRRQDTISSIPTISTPQAVPATSPPHRPRHHHRRSSHSGNPIAFEREPETRERQVCFHEEVSMRSVNGRRYMGKVEDNEWKGLSKGLERRMKEGNGGG